MGFGFQQYNVSVSKVSFCHRPWVYYSFYFDKQRDSSSKLFPCVLTKAFSTSASSDLPIPDSSHVTCRRGIVDPGNPICSVHLQVLVYSTVVHVLWRYPQFFNCPNEVTSVVRPHLSNVSSSPYKLRNLVKKESLSREWAIYIWIAWLQRHVNMTP